MNPYLSTIQALNRSGIPYVVIGGFALIMHGANRFTPDLNIVTNFEGFSKALAELKPLGLTEHPKQPAVGLTDPQRRAAWAKEGMRFYKFLDSQLPTFSLDVAIESPLPWEELSRQALPLMIQGEQIRICSRSCLIRMKTQANRPQDKMDLQSLELIDRVGNSEDPIRLEDLPKGFDIPTAESLREFQKISPDEKLEWLKNMLTALGQFCILR